MAPQNSETSEDDFIRSATINLLRHVEFNWRNPMDLQISISYAFMIPSRVNDSPCLIFPTSEMRVDT